MTAIHPIAAKLILTVALGQRVDDDLLREADALTTKDLQAMPNEVTDLLNIIYGSDPTDPRLRAQLQEVVSGSLVRMLLNVRMTKVFIGEPESYVPS